MDISGEIKKVRINSKMTLAEKRCAIASLRKMKEAEDPEAKKKYRYSLEYITDILNDESLYNSDICIFEFLYSLRERLNNKEDYEAIKAAIPDDLIENIEIDAKIWVPVDFDIDTTTSRDWEPTYRSTSGEAPVDVYGFDNIDSLVKHVKLEDLENGIAGKYTIDDLASDYADYDNDYFLVDDDPDIENAVEYGRDDY